MTPLFVVALAVCGIVQIVAIVKVFALRRRFGSSPGLSRLPEVKKWLRWCRGSWLAAVALSLIVPVVEHQQGLIVLAIGLGASTLLMIVAATASDNSTGHGDGDSGG